MRVLIQVVKNWRKSKKSVFLWLAMLQVSDAPNKGQVRQSSKKLEKMKIFGTASILAIAVLSIVNVQLTKSKNDSNQLDLSKIVSVAKADDGEYAGFSNFFQGQGFYKDESEVKRQCPTYQSTSGSGSVSGSGGGTSGSASGSGSNVQVNPPSRYDIACGSGNKNCTEVKC